MRKYTSSLVAAAIVSVGVIALPLHAQGVKPQTVTAPATPMGSETPIPGRTTTGTLYLKDYLPPTAAPVEEESSSQGARSNVLRVQPQAAAPTLNYLSTQYTCGQATQSSSLVCENDSQNYTTTATYPKTSYKIYEVFEEHGYGTQLFVRLGGSSGSLVPQSSLVETDNLCGSNYSTSCPSGSAITGFRYWYDLTSMLNGNYSRSVWAQDKGINNGPTLTTTLNIQ